MHIYFGSVTGTAENVARDTALLAETRGHDVTISELDDLTMDDLQELDDLLVVIATYGEGEMPFNAELFWDELNAVEPDLDGLTYAVLGLGDSAYEQFCQAGKDIDARLEELGAQRRLNRIDCDLDYEKTAKSWMKHAVPGDGDEDDIEDDTAEDNAPWSRANPFPATITENLRLSGPGSSKQINHIVLDLKDSGFEYQAGDSIAVIPHNDPDLVDAFLKRFDMTADATVEGFDETLGTLLETRFDITTPPNDFLRAVASVIEDAELKEAVAGDHAAIDAFKWDKDILDILNIDPRLVVPPDVLFSLLQPLKHRAYSIASSSVVHPDQVHLTVASVRWTYQQREHRGTCSTMLNDRSPTGTQARVFMVPNKRFRVPSDDNTPTIMIGPGTGIAPFIGFLDERKAKGAKGENWLFFGDREKEHDFIYEDQLTAFRNNGMLTRLDCAFSRDGSDKVYVQDRMREASEELFSWIEDGAFLYVCGDAKKMAPDVEAALCEIVMEHTGKSANDAEKYVSNLRREGRYHKDVY